MIFKTKDSDREREIEVTVSLEETDNSVRIVAKCPNEFTNTIGRLKYGKLLLYPLDKHFAEMAGIEIDNKKRILIT